MYARLPQRKLTVYLGIWEYGKLSRSDVERNQAQVWFSNTIRTEDGTVRITRTYYVKCNNMPF